MSQAVNGLSMQAQCVVQEPAKTKKSLADLDGDTLFHAFQFLSGRQLCVAFSVCRLWHQVIQRPNLPGSIEIQRAITLSNLFVTPSVDAKKEKETKQSSEKEVWSEEASWVQNLVDSDIEIEFPRVVFVGGAGSVRCRLDTDVGHCGFEEPGLDILVGYEIIKLPPDKFLVITDIGQLVLFNASKGQSKVCIEKYERLFDDGSGDIIKIMKDRNLLFVKGKNRNNQIVGKVYRLSNLQPLNGQFGDCSFTQNTKGVFLYHQKLISSCQRQDKKPPLEWSIQAQPKERFKGIAVNDQFMIVKSKIKKICYKVFDVKTARFICTIPVMRGKAPDPCDGPQIDSLMLCDDMIVDVDVKKRTYKGWHAATGFCLGTREMLQKPLRFYSLNFINPTTLKVKYCFRQPDHNYGGLSLSVYSHYPILIKLDPTPSAKTKKLV